MKGGGAIIFIQSEFGLHEERRGLGVVIGQDLSSEP